MSLKIGFSTQYYTLWDVVTSKEFTQGNKFYNVTHFNYIQNLSYSEKEAIKKASDMGCIDLVPDEELKGKSASFMTKDKPVYEEWEFNRGKYENKDIRICDDLGYLKWYFENNFKGNNEFVINRILELDTDLVFENDNFYTQKQIEGIRQYDKLSKELNKYPTEVLFKTNILCGSYVKAEIKGLEIELFVSDDVQVKGYSYNGYHYYLPTNNKGVGKRIKNKSFVCEFQMREGINHITKINF